MLVIPVSAKEGTQISILCVWQGRLYQQMAIENNRFDTSSELNGLNFLLLNNVGQYLFIRTVWPSFSIHEGME